MLTKKNRSKVQDLIKYLRRHGLSIVIKDSGVREGHSHVDERGDVPR